MNSLIKEFIETNIENIENNKWFLLFMNWYNNPHKEFPDANEWNELIEVLTLSQSFEVFKYFSALPGSIITLGTFSLDKIPFIYKVIHLYYTNDFSKCQDDFPRKNISAT